MTDAELEARLREVLTAAQHRYRTRHGWGAIVTPAIPNALIDELAFGLAPLLRELVHAAVREPVSITIENRSGDPIETAKAVQLAPTDLR